MTRGTAYLITDDTVFTTVEWNGDMYPGGHYEDLVGRLAISDTPTRFTAEMNAFNAANHNYPTFRVNSAERAHFETDGVIVFQHVGDAGLSDPKDYFSMFFSDYLFFRNAGTRAVEFRLRPTDEGEFYPNVFLEPGEVGVSYFGHDFRVYSPSGEPDGLLDLTWYGDTSAEDDSKPLAPILAPDKTATYEETARIVELVAEQCAREEAQRDDAERKAKEAAQIEAAQQAAFQFLDNFQNRTRRRIEQWHGQATLAVAHYENTEDTDSHLASELCELLADAIEFVEKAYDYLKERKDAA